MTDTDHTTSPSGCPYRADSPTALFTAEFAVDPTGVYDDLRRHAPVAPVELAPGVPATLVLSHQLALQVLHDPATFPKDSRRWLANAPADSPVVAMMEWRPNVLFADGAEHDRLRDAVTDSLASIDTATLRHIVTDSAGSLIARFAATGRADLLNDYARVLPLVVLNRLFGSSPELTDRIVHAVMALWEGVDAEANNAELGACMGELVATKRANPDTDVTSRLLEHPTNLTDEETLHQLVVLMGAGAEPMTNLIANAVRLWLTDERFAGDLSGGTMPIEDALDTVLWQDSPVANFAITYPPEDTTLGGYPIPADQPVVISLQGANTDPAVTGHSGNRAHLAFSAGPHTCPARTTARLIASIAIETIVDMVPDMELAVPADQITWRPGPFHRALSTLPVQFPPVATSETTERTATPPEETPWPHLAPTPSPAPTTSAPSAVTSVLRRGWNSLAGWRPGR